MTQLTHKRNTTDAQTLMQIFKTRTCFNDVLPYALIEPS